VNDHRLHLASRLDMPVAAFTCKLVDYFRRRLQNPSEHKRLHVMWISSWTTAVSCGAGKKVVDGSLLRRAKSALLAEARSSDRKARAVRETVDPIEHTIKCVDCGTIAEESAVGWRA
jgi:hypothetical protein